MAIYVVLEPCFCRFNHLRNLQRRGIKY